ncbi:DUF192 domain-containing protein [Idiomarina aquatica]|uniref:DUF192 domain-containing protein n=1 Tax=Idiomarina aquatica TaxID=1327752 RepID=UPI003D76960D
MTTFRQRLWGLINEPEPAASQGYWFPRCRSIHTFGMKAPIDVIGLDAEHRIRQVERHVTPNQVRYFSGCESILELTSFSPWPFQCWRGKPLTFIRQGAPTNDSDSKIQLPDFAIAIATDCWLSGDGSAVSTATTDLSGS